MEQNMILTGHNEKSLNLQNVVNIIRNAATTLQKPAEWLRNYYSHVLERNLSWHQTLSLLHVQVAMVFAIFPVDGPLLLRALCVAWFLKTVLMCKTALKG